ncbi:biotin carboxylase N-terminal domain-containing protein [Saccharothrix longispora]|uniref:ATP-binding protein n=1 Tax=Saccharothrix longispora TaxID=33920 RepID=UPI0028FD9052|nr:biotin carboxylase N-terminal domain-containing protein [Saccharothrix longispora]MDU0290386.1 biotin carboxylase N-terminal domain-containing protein [Saccharothrix longispora]
MFSRIAIVNRGEAALRLLHTVGDLVEQTGARIETVALHTDVDSAATFVRRADHAYLLGPAASRPYLDLAVLERALVKTGADAAWVGWGFVAENPDFAELCDRLGVAFIGPSAAAMRLLGDKIGSKLLAERVGVPVAAWSGGPVADLRAALEAADAVGYPLMLKASAGGGGRGIRRIDSREELAEAFERTSSEAERAFGSGVMFLERLVIGARHVEVQVIADGQGTAWALGVRDCSVQRRNQKVIEESASPVLTRDQVEHIKDAAERLACAVEYRGACTVEFLYHPGTRTFAFLEVNTRLQVEHPITEATTGFDLVRAQLQVAAGRPLTGEPPRESGHAVEARLNAEDPDRDFTPCPGRIARLDLPTGPGIRVDTGVGAGDVIPAEFDSMIAKVIAYGATRAEALARLRRALTETSVVIEGGTTNKGFLLELLSHPDVVDGTADTAWVDRMRGASGRGDAPHLAVALAVAGIEAADAADEVSRTGLLASARGGRPATDHEVTRSFDFLAGTAGHRVEVTRTGVRRYRVSVPGATEATVEVRRFDRHAAELVVDGVRHRVVVDARDPVYHVEVEGTAHRLSRNEGGLLRAPMPGLVVAAPVAVGAEVVAGDPVVVLEAMKMESAVRAPARARLTELCVPVGTQVVAGAPLARLDVGERSGVDDGSTVDVRFPAAAEESAERRAAHLLDVLHDAVLGYGPVPVPDGYLAARRELADRPLAGEARLLRVFTAVCGLSGDRAEDGGRAPREDFHWYLTTLDADRAGVSASFRRLLRAALAHYGVDDVERGDGVGEAVFRLHLALRRAGEAAEVVRALLRRWLAERPPAAPDLEAVEAALDHLASTVRTAFPDLADTARAVLLHWFTGPARRRARARAHADARRHLRHLDDAPSAPDRAERLAAVAATPEPLVRLLTGRFGRTGAGPDPLLEALAHRHYGGQALGDVRPAAVGGCAFLVAEHLAGGSRLVSTAVPFDRLAAARRGIVELGQEQTVVADVHVLWDDSPADADTAARRLLEPLSSTELPEKIGRITVTATRRGGTGHHHFTFVPGTDGLVEDRLLRGLHPYVAERVQWERMSGFTLDRLPTGDDEVALFRCTAAGDPSDVRLLALGQVRGLTARRRDDGVVELPAAEESLALCLGTIRRARLESGDAHGHRVLVYLWPPVDVEASEVAAALERMLPDADGLDLAEVLVLGHRHADGAGDEADLAVRVVPDAQGRLRVVPGLPPVGPLRPLDGYARTVSNARARGAVHPHELAGLAAGAGGTFTEYDLDGDALVPVDRPKGGNTAAVVVGVVSTPTPKHPEGVSRVILLGDATKALGALSAPECRRVIAALDLAAALRLPVEWFAVSAGARISRESGTENMDWVAAVLRRIVEFTQDGGEVNIVVSGITVGAQPYWSAEATMLMHTKGVLVMVPGSAMVLTGKRSLDFSGGVSAEDNAGIGGYDRVMGPNGQAQYRAEDLAGARDVLMAHYDHTYVVPGETGPRAASTADPEDRDVTPYPHPVGDSPFTAVGQIFSAESNPDRKKPFDIRAVLRAVSDQDRPVLERWADLVGGETAVVLDAHLGGQPVCLLGIESTTVARRGFPPADGPGAYTSGTLFPRSSKKVARAINAASGVRPVVVLANLSGFDGSPESMRELQLEFGAEIGRAVVNFRGRIVFCVVSRYHGGAFVVFSKALNPGMTVLAVEGSFASVIGGAPAAAVVFSRDVDQRTAGDPRVLALTGAGGGREHGGEDAARVRRAVRAEKLGEVAAEFDRIHDIHRAVEVGSVDRVLPARELRPGIIAAVRGASRPWRP